MSFRNTLSQWLYWIAAVILGLTPAVLAMDYGGIIPWPQHISALALMLACIVAASARFISVGCTSEIRLPPTSFQLTGILTLLLAGAAFQTVPLPQGIVAWISPASHSAHTQWISQLIEVDAQRYITVSIAAFDSRHAIAYLAIVTLVSFLSVIAVQDRGRITWILASVTFLGCSIAALGLARKLVPSFDLWSFQSGGEGAPFGTFLNRNNAALGINLGIGTAIGLVAWRKMVLDPTNQHSTKNRPPAFTNWQHILRLMKDPVALAALACISVCLIGLIACGSRGGLLSMIAGGSLTLFLMRGKIGRLSGVFAGVTVVVLILFALLRTETLGNNAIQDDALKQFESTVQLSSQRFAADTRLAHWPDGLRTATKHFPGGSGLGSYGYAYLPWQKTSPWRLCEHADNLWLEMLVELGLIGIVVLSITGLSLLQSFSRLAKSSDPLDQGLLAVGWYFTGTIIVSQFFDFGLIIPSNLLPVVLLYSIIIARSGLVVVAAVQPSSNAYSDRRKPKLVLMRRDVRWWRSPIFLREQLFQSIAIAGLFAISIPAINRLRLDSDTDYAIRFGEQQFGSIRLDLAQTSKLVNSTRQLAEIHPHPDLLNLLSTLQFQQGRLEELALMNVGRMPQSQQQRLYLATSKSRRRLCWRISEPQLSKHVSYDGTNVIPLPLNRQLIEDDSPYAHALKTSELGVLCRPLSLRPRADQIALEFIHQNLNRTHIAITQSAKLFRNTPELQFRLGQAAANHGDYRTAHALWQRCIQLRPEMNSRIQTQTNKYAEFPL